MKEIQYTPLHWDEIEDDAWEAAGTVYSASADDDPFHFRVRLWRGLFRIDTTDSELIPDEIAAAFVGKTFEAANFACERFNREAFDAEGRYE